MIRAHQRVDLILQVSDAFLLVQKFVRDGLKLCLELQDGGIACIALLLGHDGAFFACGDASARIGRITPRGFRALELRGAQRFESRCFDAHEIQRLAARIVAKGEILCIASRAMKGALDIRFGCNCDAKLLTQLSDEEGRGGCGCWRRGGLRSCQRGITLPRTRLERFECKRSATLLHHWCPHARAEER